MALALVIHQGVLCPDELLDAAAPYSDEHTIRIGTARTGPEKTDYGPAQDVAVVVTDDKDVAEYWDGRAEVQFLGADGLPEGFPKRDSLREAGLASKAEVRSALDDGTITDISGIGPATADKIKSAL